MDEDEDEGVSSHIHLHYLPSLLLPPYNLIYVILCDKFQGNVQYRGGDAREDQMDVTKNIKK